MAGPGPKSESLPEQGRDLVQLVIAYARQETIDPIKGLGRFLAFGMAGALAGSVGLVLLLLGTLRLLQTETGSAFDGRRTWIPYLLVVLVAGGVAGGAMKVRTRGQRRNP